MGLATVMVAVIVLMTGASRRVSRAFRREASQLLAAASSVNDRVVTEADLARLPSLVSRYLRGSGVVGRPFVASVHSAFTARMRNGRDTPWMKATVDQWNFLLEPKARLFLMKATRGGIPFTAFHRYVGNAATFEVRIAGLLPIIRVSGPTMSQSETVTLFNDMCLLAPASLIDPAISWTELDSSRVRGEFANAGHRISAELTFDDAGDLVNFRSEDRYQNDGKVERQLPWTTPVSGYRDFDGMRLFRAADACWIEDGREWVYGHFELQRIDYNLTGVPTP
jgi:hypothetical protein